MTSGIYIIWNTINDKIYVGSSINIDHRWRYGHRPNLYSDQHYNKHLQASWNKYSETAFELIVQEVTDNLVDRERFWVSELDPEYNKCREIGSSTRGIKFGPTPEAVRRKISAAQKGVPRHRITRGTRKLTFSQAQEIRQRYGTHSKNGRGRSHRSISMSGLATEYGITTAQICEILNNHSYTKPHVKENL